MKIIITALSTVAFAFALSACGDDPCETLKSQCDACADQTQMGLCRTVYETGTLPVVGDDRVCQEALDAKTWESC